MKTKGKNKNNYVDALENDHLYAVLTKQGRLQILVQPTVKQLRKRGTRGWRLFSTVDSGLPVAGPSLTETVQRAIQEMESTGATLETTETSISRRRPPRSERILLVESVRPRVQLGWAVFPMLSASGGKPLFGHDKPPKRGITYWGPGSPGLKESTIYSSPREVPTGFRQFFFVNAGGPARTILQREVVNKKWQLVTLECGHKILLAKYQQSAKLGCGFCGGLEPISK
jgi:hypothetical protein